MQAVCDPMLISHELHVTVIRKFTAAGRMEAETTVLINQQLAVMHAPEDPNVELPDGPPSIRVCLQMQQVRDSPISCS